MIRFSRWAGAIAVVANMAAPQTRVSGMPGATSPAAPAGTAVLAGTIRADDGTPVRRAIVRLNGSRDPGGSRVSVTDDSGRFTYAELPAATFTLSASRAGFVTTYYGSRRPGRGPALPIALAAGQRISISLTMLRGAAIAGAISDPFGRPAPQVTVQAVARGVAAAPRTVESAPTSAVTDERGAFRLYGLAPGDYIVSAVARPLGTGEARVVTSDAVRWAQQQLSSSAGLGAGAAPAGSSSPPANRPVVYAPVYYPGTFVFDAATAITIGAGEDREGVSFALQLVPTSKIDGVVLNAAGQTVSDALVVLMPRAAGRAPSLASALGAGIAAPSTLARPAVSAAGTFSIPNVTPGDYVVMASDALTAASRGAGGAGSQWGEADVTVYGDDLADVAIRLQPGVTLSGSIVFEGASPAPAGLEGVSVSLLLRRDGAPPFARAPVANIAAPGTFVIPGVMPGPYTIAAAVQSPVPGAPHWWLKSIVAGGRDVTDGTVALGAGEDMTGVVVTFTDKETSVSGTLYDAAGRATSAFSIVIFATDRAYWAPGSRRVRLVRPATDGTFRIAGLPAGPYEMVAVSDLEPEALEDPSCLEQLESAAP